MNNPLHAAYYADQAQYHKVVVTECELLALETYRIRFVCPSIASIIRPGQFVMVRQPDCAEPLLGRAFALYDVVDDQQGTPRALDIVFHTVGKLTGALAEMQGGERLSVWGPLGNGFLPQPTEHLIMVAGGIGQTPFLALAKEYLGARGYGRVVPQAQHVTLCYGARSKAYLAGVTDFQEVGVDVKISTDDGSAGEHGLVTSLLDGILPDRSHGTPRVVCCGPEPMMEAVSDLCAQRGVGCQVSLETPMACGIGICFSCVTRVRQTDGSWDFKRTCVDGPVFESTDLVW